MFVLKSTYKEEVYKRRDAEQLLRAVTLELSSLSSKWNNLVSKINEKGGQEFLEKKSKHVFSKIEIKQLINLCHPDKHNGKKLALKITAQLNVIKDSM